ncbi:MAG: hypothetical protein VXY94_02000 [Planctomycetota bacterium]|nr:hypothetical protein [Planctomycetota bacterium]MEC9157870.1 hypothetical protein [Planctomycetota bacterium]MED5506922.1 hypothetical protein [Planctomycetota bacterium]MED6306987.1 hypothetical protein [Planctomycetota bacterium]
MLACTAGALLLLTGCGGDDKPTPVVIEEPEEVIDRTPAPPPITPVADLMSRHGIDDRIRLMESDAPGTDAERVAVLKFFNAMTLTGNPEFEQMLSDEDQREYRTMIQQQDLQDEIGRITGIRLQCGASPDFKPAVVAIIETYDGWHPQLWTYSVAENSMSARPVVFTSGPTPLSVMSKLGMSKLGARGQVARWYELLDEELTIADLPEQDVEQVKIDLRNEVNNVSEAGTGPGPSGPTTPGRSRPKRDKKFDAPSLTPSR